MPDSTVRRKTISAAIRAEMLLRGVRRHDLARDIGAASQSVANVISGGDPSTIIRAKIEAYFGRAFWSTPDDAAARKSAKEYFGVDIHRLPRGELNGYARKFLPPGDFRSHFRSRPELLRRLALLAGEQTNQPHAETLPPQRGADGGTPADFPPGSAAEPAATKSATAAEPADQ